MLYINYGDKYIFLDPSNNTAYLCIRDYQPPSITATVEIFCSQVPSLCAVLQHQE